jgi:uncharacterized membrane protein YgcG
LAASLVKGKQNRLSLSLHSLTMHRFLFILLLFVSAGMGWPTARAQAPTAGLPARPSPFRFVTDQAQMLSAADAKTLENGLRRYADSTGNQIVVVTVPSLGGRTVSDYGRALGESWGVGQRGKNNGLVVLLSEQEHKVTIQAGEGMRNKVTPEIVAQVINQQMTPSFKQGRYFAGLRSGLYTLMTTATPGFNSSGRQSQTAASSGAANSAAGVGAAASSTPNNDLATTNTAQSDPYTPSAATPTPAPSGPGMGTLLIGALLVGGVLWFIIKMFRRRSQANNTSMNGGAPGGTPNFYPNQPGGNQAGGYGPGQRGPTPNFYPNQQGGGMGNNMGGGMGNMGGGMGGSGIGGMLATGAAAAAGAYLGNRMAGGGHDNTGNGLMGTAGAENMPHNLDPNANANYGGAPSGEFPALGGAAGSDFNNDNGAEQYFSDASSDEAGDYFSSGDSSYDDSSSDDTGGGGFDDNSDNSGSW